MTQSDRSASAQPALPTREEIAAAGSEVNEAANELAASVKLIEDYLETRNIGVPAWVRVKGWSNDGEDYWFRELGYDLIHDSWHLAIRERSGDERWPDRETVRKWSFNNSPRKARISAADKIPDLLRELIKESERTARRLREKTTEVNAFMATLNIAPKKAQR